MGDWGNAGGGAASGALAGSALGPWGTLAGGLIGGALGYFGGSGESPEDAARRKAIAELGTQLNGETDYLRRIARGQESVSAMQLRDALARTNAQQASMAAAAAPRDSTMAALMASRNAMQASSGLAGQQAIAGIQERQAAQSQLVDALLRQRQQDIGGGGPTTPTWLERWGPAIQSGLTIYGLQNGKSAPQQQPQRPAPPPGYNPNVNPWG